MIEQRGAKGSKEVKEYATFSGLRDQLHYTAEATSEIDCAAEAIFSMRCLS
jgi:hypothetical protein